MVSLVRWPYIKLYKLKNLVVRFFSVYGEEPTWNQDFPFHHVGMLQIVL